MPLPQSPEPSRGYGSRAGQVLGRSATATSSIDAVLAQNKDALEGKSLLDRVFPTSPQEDELYDTAEENALQQGKYSPGEARVGPEHVAGELRNLLGLSNYEGPVEGAPARLRDPHHLISPYGRDEEQSFRNVSDVPSPSNIDVLNMHREQGIQPFGTMEGDENYEYQSRNMLSRHATINAFNPTSLHDDFTPDNLNASVGVQDLRLKDVTREIHGRLRENPEIAEKFTSPQFAGSLMHVGATHRRQDTLGQAGISPNAVYSEKYAPGSTGDVYVHHDPEEGTTHTSVRFPGTDRELYSIKTTDTDESGSRRHPLTFRPPHRAD